MMKITELTFKLIEINSRISDLYAEKKQLEKDLKIEHDRLIELCGSTGKTVDELEESEG